MATAERMRAPLEQPVEKGLKPGALGLVSTTVIATASVAPAYSIAATLVFVVGAVGLQAPAASVAASSPSLRDQAGEEPQDLLPEVSRPADHQAGHGHPDGAVAGGDGQHAERVQVDQPGGPDPQCRQHACPDPGRYRQVTGWPSR
jgi:hypothetical protein